MSAADAEKSGFTITVYRGVSKSKPFSGKTSWWTTSKDAAEAYAKDTFGYDDADVVEGRINPSGIPRHNIRKLTEEQLKSLEPDEFGNPQKIGIYEHSDDSIMGSSTDQTIAHVPNENVVTVKPKEPVTGAEAPAAPKAKEPWEMTKAEWIDATNKKYAEDNAKLRAQGFSGVTPNENAHYNQVKHALEAGKPVPPEVLADYPDLQPKSAPAAETTGGKGVQPWKKTEFPQVAQPIRRLQTDVNTFDNAGVLKPIKGVDYLLPGFEEYNFAVSRPSGSKQLGTKRGWTVWEKTSGWKVSESTDIKGKPTSESEAVKLALDRLRAMGKESIDNRIAGIRDAILKASWERAENLGVTPEPTPPPPAETGAEMRPGPGAMTRGAQPTAPIQELDDALRAQTPVGTRDRMAIAEKAADAWAQGRNAVDRGIARLRAITTSLKDAARGVRAPRDIDRRIGEFDWATQKSAAQSKRTGQTIRETYRSEADRGAAALWADTPGTDAQKIAIFRNALANLPRGTPTNIRKALERAANMSQDAKQLTESLRQFFGLREQDAVAEDIFRQGLEDYYTHIWGKESNMPDQLRSHLSNGRVNEYFQFARQRSIPTLVDGILAGKKPVLDPAAVVPFYNYALDRAIASRKLISELEKLDSSELVDPSDPSKGFKPALAATGTRSTVGPVGSQSLLIRPQSKNQLLQNYRPVDHPALKKWKWADTDPATGKTVLYEGDLYVHPEFYERVANMMARDRLSPGAFMRGMLKVSGEVKGFKLGLLSGFHTVHVASHAAFHWTNPFKAGWTPIDWESPATKFAVEKGHLKIAPNPAELAQFSEGILQGNWSQKIPVLGPWSKAFSEWNFGEFIPRLKMATFENAYARNLWMRDHGFPGLKGMSDEMLAARVGDSVNFAFGELNQLFMGKNGRNPTTQRLLRLGFLAPDFGEARLRFVEKSLTAAGWEERLALATMFLTLYGTARIGNWLSHGDSENDLKHAFQVKIGDHWWGMRSVIGDLDHALTDFRNFIQVRLNPVFTRTLLEVGTKTDPQGRRLSWGEIGMNLAKQVLPIHLSALGRDDKQLWESAITAMGVQALHETPQNDIYRLLDNFKAESKDPKLKAQYERSQKEVHAASDYKPLRNALYQENIDHAVTEYQRLLKNGKDASTIRKAMEWFNAAGYAKPFSGSADTEAKFKRTLSKEQLVVYNRAVEDRRKLYIRFNDMLKYMGTRKP